MKATDMGSSTVKFKAEVDFDGKEITRLYMENLDVENMLIVRLESFSSSV